MFLFCCPNFPASDITAQFEVKLAFLKIVPRAIYGWSFSREFFFRKKNRKIEPGLGEK
jgi:hypothetical protein